VIAEESAALSLKRSQVRARDNGLRVLIALKCYGGCGVSAAAAAAAEVAGAAGGRVVLWSLKNQLHSIWTFETKPGVCKGRWVQGFGCV
jgi:hypothetical protein